MINSRSSLLCAISLLDSCLYIHMVDQYIAKEAGDNWFNIIAPIGEVLSFDKYDESVLKIGLLQKSRRKEIFYAYNLEE